MTVQYVNHDPYARCVHFSTLHLLAALPGKNSRLRRSGSFPGGRSAAGARVPRKIYNARFRDMILKLRKNLD